MRFTRRGERVINWLLIAWCVGFTWFGRGIIWPNIQF